jgi:hypothetical protein
LLRDILAQLYGLAVQIGKVNYSDLFLALVGDLGGQFFSDILNLRINVLGEGATAQNEAQRDDYDVASFHFSVA